MTDETEGRDPANGRFLPSNRFWEARSSAGPTPKFANGADLWAACSEYFEWVDANPLYEDKVFSFQGAVIHTPSPKMRAMTIGGLCNFLDIDRQTWANWKADRADLFGVITRAEEIIRDQKFTGAAADLLNANIIARDLGLADRSEITGKDGGAIKTEGVSDRELAKAVLALMAKADGENDSPEMA